MDGLEGGVPIRWVIRWGRSLEELNAELSIGGVACGGVVMT